MEDLQQRISTTSHKSKSEDKVSKNGDKKKEKAQLKKSKQMASIPETMSFVFACGLSNKLFFAVGAISAFFNGLVGPMLAVLFSIALSRASNVGVDIEDIAFDDIKQVSFGLVLVGIWAFFMTFVQTVCFEIAAFRAAHSLNLQWFQALLRQDAAFYDVYDVPGIASIVQPTCYLYRRGMGSKFGEGIQYTTTVIGGVGFAFVASWRISILVLAILPFCIICSVYAIHLSQNRTARSNKSYKHAGTVAYSTISSLRTILAFNAVPQMIDKYKEATEEAAKISTRFLFKYGIVSGFFLSSYIVMFIAVSMYGAKLLYTDIEEFGCDPTAGIFSEMACETTGASILGSFLGFLFAAEGMSQVATFFEALVEARVAAFEALRAIQRETGAPREIIYHPDDGNKSNKRSNLPGLSDTESESVDEVLTLPPSTTRKRLNTDEIEFTGTLGSSIDCGKLMRACHRKLRNDNKTKADSDLEQGIIAPLDNVKAILPKFEIDSSEDSGMQPREIHGNISFKHVCFSYPTRPADRILRNFSLDIQAGQTIAFVGPSGSGKSTIVSMVERFYDPSSGMITLDGVNLKHLNVSYLRHLIGYVGQEPTLFATTIRENIEYGCPGATDEQIVAAARMANAHDFICEFPEGYDTQVGDKGSQLSGGQRQRIAISRALVSNKKILLLDEATSALDSESELVVQNAIDNVLAQKNLTTIIIAHRLSTIRNADVIAVVVDGGIVETGTHDKLMEDERSYYRKLVRKQEGPKKSRKVGASSSSSEETSSAIVPLDRSYSCVSTLDAPDTVELRTATSMSRPNNIEVVYYPKQQVQEPDIPHINFKNVSFAYPTRPSKPVFDGFNLSIRCGETVALVGPSGGGKSTTVQMIERYYDPYQGVLEYMGHDARTLNPHWYRDQIGLVSQEPSLLNETIRNNIAFGNKSATNEMIIQAAKQANAHDFILSFPDGYNTEVGNRGAQLSGGQRQRIAIARALLKTPKVLILDEATSALDSQSESVVQAALDKLMASRSHTTIVIAHRLSTVRHADRIAFIAEGRVHEIGTHDELMARTNGRYRRLVGSQMRNSTLMSVGLLDDTLNLSSSSSDSGESKSSTSTIVESELAELGTTYFSARRIWREAAQDKCYIMMGSLGAIVNGAIFPAWGIMFAQTINLLFRRVLECPNDDEVPDEDFATCQEYWSHAAEDMRQLSIKVGLAWCVVVVASLGGAISSKVGFGTAAERLNKRIRDNTFSSLVRQDLTFFDKHSIGKIMSVLQDDTTKLYAFTGEPLRMFWIGVSSVAIGVVLAFIFVWPVALLSLGCIPLMGYALSLRMGSITGLDRGAINDTESDSPSGIVVETLVNIRSVAALTLEQRKFEEFKESLKTSEPNNYWESVKTAVSHGMAYLLHHWVDSLLFYFAGWLLHTYPTKFTFLEVLNSNFALYFSLFGLGVALKEVADREEIKQATSRVFYILDRTSALDPLSTKGHKLD